MVGFGSASHRRFAAVYRLSPEGKDAKKSPATDVDRQQDAVAIARQNDAREGQRAKHIALTELKHL